VGCLTKKGNPVPVLKAMMIAGLIAVLASGLGRCAFLIGLNLLLFYFYWLT
jgi:hypothetical protein